MKKTAITCAIALALLAGACSGNGKKEAAASTDSDAVATQTESGIAVSDEYKLVDGTFVSANGLPMIIDFSAEWCPPCRQLKPVFEELEKEYAGKINFITVNVDSMPSVAQNYKVESIPNLVFAKADGTEVYRSVGFREGAELKAYIEKYLSE